jgi:hypothetical protein
MLCLLFCRTKPYENEQFSREQSFHLQKYGKQKHHTLEEAAAKYAALMPLLEELEDIKPKGLPVLQRILMVCNEQGDFPNLKRLVDYIGQAANLTTQIKEIMEKE